MHQHPRLPAALAYADAAHAGQKRKGTEIPYISHLISVAGLVIEHHGDEEQAIAALLHDVVEDCGAQHQPVIRELFGDRVADIVLACTDDAPEGGREKRPWRDRKVEHLAKLDALADRDGLRAEDALLVCLCDKLHNARAVVSDLERDGADTLGRFNGGPDGTLWYYREAARVFAGRLGAGHPAVRELSATVARMAALAGGG